MVGICDPTGAYGVNKVGRGPRASCRGGRSLQINTDECEGPVVGAMGWWRGIPGVRFARMLDLRTVATYNNFGVESAFLPLPRMTTPRQRRRSSRENWFGEAGLEELGTV